jgi:hypothetical protein
VTSSKNPFNGAKVKTYAKLARHDRSRRGQTRTSRRRAAASMAVRSPKDGNPAGFSSQKTQSPSKYASVYICRRRDAPPTPTSLSPLSFIRPNILRANGGHVEGKRHRHVTLETGEEANCVTGRGCAERTVRKPWMVEKSNLMAFDPLHHDGVVGLNNFGSWRIRRSSWLRRKEATTPDQVPAHSCTVKTVMHTE